MASRQFVIIGLGNSANYLARHLTSLGHDIMVIDSHPEKVQDFASMVSQAVVADSTRKKQLASIPALTKADSVIVCIGSNLEASLLTILNLKELGVKHIIAKSSSAEHTSILEKLGVTDKNGNRLIEGPFFTNDKKLAPDAQAQKPQTADKPYNTQENEY